MVWGGNMNKGLAAHDNKDYVTALREFNAVVKDGDTTSNPDYAGPNNSAHAMLMLAVMYSNGQGVTTNNNKTIELLRSSANLGLAYSQYLLAKELVKNSNTFQEGAVWVKVAHNNKHLNQQQKNELKNLRKSNGDFIFYQSNSSALNSYESKIRSNINLFTDKRTKARKKVANAKRAEEKRIADIKKTKKQLIKS